MMKFNYAMEAALNAASLAPISVLCEKRSDHHHQHKKPSSLPIASTSRTFQGGLALMSSALGIPSLAQALTYEEALGQSVTAPAFDGGAGGVLDSVISFAAGNPVVIAGGVAVLAVPLVLSRVFGKPKPYGVESARKAYGVLGDDPSAQLLDIRAPVEVRKMGSPDVRGLGKKPVPIVYIGEDKPGFLKKLSLKLKEPAGTTLYILDKFDGNSELVAELVTVNGFKAAYAIKDGAEGPKGWMNSSLPWIPPKKSFSFDLSSISDSINEALGESFDTLSVGLGLAAATGIGLLTFSEIETILQLLGSAALVQFASKKLLFEEDRKETLKQLNEFLNTKVAPAELVDDIKQIGIALLPLPAGGKSLPAPGPAAAESTVQKSEVTPVAAPESTAEAAPVAAPEPTAEVAPEPALQINSEAKTEVIEEPITSFPRPLSPYPSYADFKPPSSPSPSQP